jgi:omega-amidase
MTTMPGPLRVTIVQTTLHWQDPAANRTHFNALLSGVPETDLIVLPEMFSTGFTMEPEGHAESADGESVHWLAALSKRLGCAVTGSLCIESGGRYFNRLYWAQPGGTLRTYDKRHLFRMAGEHEHYQAGSERVIADVKGWRVCPLICYDLRFPVWSRRRADYDLLVYVANWPVRRRTAWQTLLRARAIENQVYALGVNRIGRDGAVIDYAGDSAVIDPLGEALVDLGSAESVKTVTLDYGMLEKLRQHFPVHLDADAFSIEGAR